MVKGISYESIIGNALISTKREYMTKGQIYQYCNIVDTLLPDDYYTCHEQNSFENFCETYGFLVKRIGDIAIINCDIA